MSPSCRRFRRILVVSIVLAAVAGDAPGATAATPRTPTAPPPVRVGSAAETPRGAHVLGVLPDTSSVQLTIALAPRDPAGLQAAATAVSTPGSPDYRHYLTVAQFAQRFGATPADIAAVASALRSQGLAVGTPLANALTLPVTGTAAQVEQAFATTLAQVKLPSGRTAYENTVAPTLPASWAKQVQGVIGLDNLPLAHPAGLSRPGFSRPPAPGPASSWPARARPASSSPARARPASSSPASVATGGPQPSCSGALGQASSGSGYTADRIAAAYGFSGLYRAGDRGAGQTIALYELESYAPADIAAYQACYGVQTSVSAVPVGGFHPTGPGSGEAELDIEQVIGLAPAAKILVYQASNSEAAALDAYAQIVSQNRAKVVSSSWGQCEPSTPAADVTAENTLFQEAAIQGQSIFAASGDGGSAACAEGDPNPTSANSQLAVGDPASQPFATGVGGTSLYTPDPRGGYALWGPGAALDETVWNDGIAMIGASGPGASTGGVSSLWPMPSYQARAGSNLGVGSGGSRAPCRSATLCREVPDVSANADPLFGYVLDLAGSWTAEGGTSATAPLWAAFTALANASAACHGHPIGFENPALYQIAGSSAYATDFRDITLPSPITGRANNDALAVNNGLYPVKPGYDMATGLGTPIGSALASSLCAVSTVTVAEPGGQSGTVGTPAELQIQATDSGGASLTFAASGLPAGLRLNPSSGWISGTPRAAGTSTVNVSAIDQQHNSGSAQFTWTIVNPPRFSRISLAGLASGQPRLSFSVGAASRASALKSISVGLPTGLSFVHRAVALAQGIVVTSAARKVSFKADVRRGRLAISLTGPATTASVTIEVPAIRVSPALESKVHHHEVGQLALGLAMTDTREKTTGLSIKLSV